MAKQTVPPLPLPKNWPRRVRSAVIQVISLAHFSLITTRSWAADSWDSYPAGTTFAGAGLPPAGTTSLCTAHLAYYTGRWSRLLSQRNDLRLASATWDLILQADTDITTA